MLIGLDAAAVRHWCASALAALREHEREIDDLNVFPVPDGDTGRNLVLTFTSAWEALDADADADADAGLAADAETTKLGRVLRCMARGALLGARGNSGVILSQVLRGVADALAAAPEARGLAMAQALTRAADAGYAAVAEPVEGTVLSVARAAARAAEAAHSDDLAAVCVAAAKGAADALALTPTQLPALARAGVVDAGGRGLVVLLDSLVGVVTGNAPAITPLARVARDPSLLVERETGSPEFAYEVQFLLDATPAAVEAMKESLLGLGDSLVVVGAGEIADVDLWNVHVHVNDVGAAIEAGIQAGRPHRLSVTRFSDQFATHAAPQAESRAVVAVTHGAGLRDLFATEGALVVDGGPTSNPSTAEVLAGIRRTGAANVVVLPNHSNVLPVARTAAEEARSAGFVVAVVPTRSPVQGLAALAVRDPSRRFDEDVIAMTAASGGTRWAELTFAVRDALTVAGRCAAGDVLGMVEGEVVLVADGSGDSALGRAGVDLLDRMLGGGGELVTLVTGAVPDADLATVTAHLRRAWPLVEFQVVHGGQPHQPLLIGVE